MPTPHLKASVFRHGNDYTGLPRTELKSGHWAGMAMQLSNDTLILRALKGSLLTELSGNTLKVTCTSQQKVPTKRDSFSIIISSKSGTIFIKPEAEPQCLSHRDSTSSHGSIKRPLQRQNSLRLTMDKTTTQPLFTLPPRGSVSALESRAALRGRQRMGTSGYTEAGR